MWDVQTKLGLPPDNYQGFGRLKLDEVRLLTQISCTFLHIALGQSIFDCSLCSVRLIVRGSFDCSSHGRW